MTSPTLFSPVRAGALDLANRIVMAPLTRNRAIGQVPNALMVEYYRQRATYYERVYHKPERQHDLRAMEAWLPPQFAGRRDSQYPRMIAARA